MQKYRNYQPIKMCEILMGFFSDKFVNFLYITCIRSFTCPRAIHTFSVCLQSSLTFSHFILFLQNCSVKFGSDSHQEGVIQIYTSKVTIKGSKRGKLSIPLANLFFRTVIKLLQYIVVQHHCEMKILICPNESPRV